LIAHRGVAGARPENTMAAVEKAIEDGADWVEIDVQETADGEVVVIHDSDFMKIAGVDLKVWDATMEDIAEIDIGSWFGPDYEAERAPTLRAVLDAAKGRAGVLIELKYYGHDERLEARVAEIVAAAGMEDQVQVMSLKLPGVRKMAGLRPDWPAGLLASASLGRVWELDVDFLAVNQAAASPLLVRKLRERGKPLYVWTVDDALSMSAMVSLGASGLITNEPALARDVLAQREALSRGERAVLLLADRLGVDLERKAYRDDSP
ncbi:MAG TPA: glycerophosphodiester phosphodiesterase, partial [Rhodobacteraceae bacterium]|nr:glycerophosphodiester phosphodiesterase [Paracoccaceae bacterium]